MIGICDSPDRVAFTDGIHCFLPKAIGTLDVSCSGEEPDGNAWLKEQAFTRKADDALAVQVKNQPI